MERYKRTYQLVIDTNVGNSLEFKNELHINYNVSRQMLASMNGATIEIYNLSEEHRNLIRQDRMQFDTYRQVRLSVGYGNDLSLIFQGNIQTAQSYKERTEFCTKIVAQDGQFAYLNSYTSQSISNPTGAETYDKVYTVLMQDLQKASIGYIAPSGEPLPARGIVLNGKTTNLLDGLNDRNFFIDDEQAFLIKQDQVRYTFNKVIDQYILLNTPMLYDNYLQVETLLYPDIGLNEMITLYSTSAKQWNGEYKVLGIEHRGNAGLYGSDAPSTTTLKLDLLGKMFETIVA